MHYVSRCAANRWVFNADLKLSMISVGSEESPETSSRLSELQWRMIDVRTCCDGVVDSWHDQLTPVGWPQALTTGNVRRTHTAVHQVLGSTILEAPIHVTASLYWTRWWISSQCSSEWSRWDKPRSNFAHADANESGECAAKLWWSHLHRLHQAHLTYSCTVKYA